MEEFDKTLKDILDNHEFYSDIELDKKLYELKCSEPTGLFYTCPRLTEIKRNRFPDMEHSRIFKIKLNE